MLLQMGRLERTSSSFCLSKGTIFSLTTTLSSSKSSMMKSWLSLSMFTMMDLMEGSHSIRTPAVCENGTGQLRCSSAGNVERMVGIDIRRTSDCARHFCRSYLRRFGCTW